MLSSTEENYLKEIYHLSSSKQIYVSTNTIAESMHTSAASVTDMIKKLAAKDLLDYQPYRGVKVSKSGQDSALKLIRKHRLWETFLVQKLHFSWDEVHVVAEQLEHVKSALLISRLDEFLNFPKVDPHGDPIPDDKGEFPKVKRKALADLLPGSAGVLIMVRDSSSDFLQFLDRIGINIGCTLELSDRFDFDGSVEIIINSSKKVFISKEVANNLYVL